MTTDLAIIAPRYNEMNKAVEMYLKGTNPTQIARELNIKRTEVLAYVDQYNEFAKQDPVIQERMRETIQNVDSIVKLVQKRNWETVEQADDAGDLKTKATVLKNIVEAEVKLQEMYQKAGLLQDAELGDELAKTQERQELLGQLISEVIAECQRCKPMLATRIRDAMNNGQETIVVV